MAAAGRNELLTSTSLRCTLFKKHKGPFQKSLAHRVVHISATQLPAMPTTQVFDLHRKGLSLSLPHLGEGGEGAVYRLKERPDVAIKLFNPEKIAKHGPQLREKLEVQIQLAPHLKCLPLSWPLLSVFNNRHEWSGYAMRTVSGKPLTLLANRQRIETHFPAFGRTHLVKVLISLLQTAHALHQHSIMIGDVNLNNFLCDPNNGQVSLIDCDSYQVTTPDGRHFPCLVGSPNLTAPEHLGQDFSRVQRTLASDAFSLAILVFQCLMLGRHPYDCVGGSDPVKNMQSGHFPYGKGGSAPGFEGAIPAGPWYIIWSHLTFKLKDLMIHTFREGAGDPARRGTVSEWIGALQGYLWTLEKGHVSSDLVPKTPKTSNLNPSYSN